MSALRLPRILRLDPSDTFVFERAAEPGEWAVTGSFLFTDIDPADLSGKGRAAFRSGFVGVRSFGFSTLVVVSEASERERDEAIEDLARHIRRDLGAPSDELAREAAREELGVAASLCGPAVNSVLALQRSLVNGELREQFRVLVPRDGGGGPGADRLHLHARAFAMVEVDEDEPEERVDLVGLVGRGAA